MLIALNESLDLSQVSVVTPKLCLTSLASHHASIIAQEFDDNITRYMVPNPIKSVPQAIYFINTATQLKRENKALILAVTHPISLEFLGVVALVGHQNLVAPELGVWIKKSAHGHYYGRYAVHALCAWAMNHLRITHFVYPVSKLNIPSQKIAMSLGGTRVAEKMTKKESGEMMDEWVYHIDAQKIRSYLLEVD